METDAMPPVPNGEDAIGEWMPDWAPIATKNNGVAVDDAPLSDQAVQRDHGASDTAAATAADDRRQEGIEIDFDDPHSILALKMSGLTLEKRCEIYEDIHGVNPMQEETDAFLATKLDSLEMELEMIKNKPAYDVAKQTNSAYITSRKLCIGFLRCDDFDSCKAARRLVGWCEVKMELFGADVMGRDLRLSDLCPESRKLMESGVAQMIPKPDSAGRTIFYGMQLCVDHFTNMAFAKATFYMSNCNMYNETTQRNGSVGIHGFDRIFSEKCTAVQARNMLESGSKMTKFSPLKIRAFHYIGDDSPATKRIASIMQMAFSKETGYRLRFHCGTIEQNLLALTGFGIPVDALPFDDDGNFDLTNHHAWLEERKKREAELSQQLNGAKDDDGTLVHATSIESEDSRVGIQEFSHQNSDLDSLDDDSLLLAAFSIEDGRTEEEEEESKTAPPSTSRSTTDGPATHADTASTTAQNTDEEIEPTDNDILMGRGRDNQNHPGNIHFRSLIAEMYDKYDQSRRWGKMAVAESVVDIIIEKNGRFLKKGSGGCWAPVTREEAREKVSHGFRKKRELDLAKEKRKRETEA